MVEIKPRQQVFIIAMSTMRTSISHKTKLYKMSKKFLDRWEDTPNKDEMYLTKEEMDFFFEKAN